jgi:N-acyl-D-amino-acid deacylase
MINRRDFLKGAGIAATACLTAPLLSCIGGSDSVDGVYDTIIRNGTLYDGTTAEPRLADIGIAGDRIVAVGNITGAAARVIDAVGCIVTPGFIDVHEHSDTTLIASQREQARTMPTWAGNHGALIQGVTTVISGNCGYGYADMNDYYAFLDSLPFGSNTYYLSPHGYLRLDVFKDAQPEGELDSAQLERLKNKLAEEMEKGAIGMSTGLSYAPGYLATTKELIELAKVIKGYGGIFACHNRYDDPAVLYGNGNADSFAGIQEAIEVGRKAGVPVQISHIKGFVPCTPDVPATILRMVEDARKEGIDVTVDQYPYTGASTLLTILVPARYRTSMGIKREYWTPEGRVEIKAAIERTLQVLPPDKILIGEWSTYRLETLQEIAQAEGRSAADLYVDMVCVEEPPGGIYFYIDETCMETLMVSEFIFTGSDGAAMPQQSEYGHPRSTGTFARKLGWYAMKKGLMSVQDAILSMTSRPAEKFGLKERGKILKGYFADITVIDPARYQDQATYRQPSLYAEGVKHVLVNGLLEVENGAFTGLRNGRAIRRS